MRFTDWIFWAAAAIVADVVTMVFFGLSWLPLVLVSLIIMILFVLRQAVRVGLFTDYRRSLTARFGKVQASVYGLEWIVGPSDKQGKHCDMHVFKNHVAIVTPEPLAMKKVDVFEVGLANIAGVKLGSDGLIYIKIAKSAASELVFKSSQHHDKLTEPLKTLQTEIIYERQAQVVRKVTEKAIKIEQELHRGLEERRRQRIEKLHGAKGHNLVERFTAIIPSDIFIKDTLFEKIKELLMLELKGRKSTLQGRLEEFLDNDFKPFAQVMRDKADFDLEDYEDLCLLLQEIRAQVRQNAGQSFAERYAEILEPLPEAGADKLIEAYVSTAGPAAGEIEDLEGLRLYLDDRGYRYNFKAIRQRVEDVRTYLSVTYK